MINKYVIDEKVFEGYSYDDIAELGKYVADNANGSGKPYLLGGLQDLYGLNIRDIVSAIKIVGVNGGNVMHPNLLFGLVQLHRASIGGVLLSDFKDLGLYVNSSDYVERYAAMWRLNRGR